MRRREERERPFSYRRVREEGGDNFRIYDVGHSCLRKEEEEEKEELFFAIKSVPG